MALLRPDASQVVTWQGGSAGLASPRWLGEIGYVTGLVYSFACPGGPDQLTCNLEVDARYRTDALDPGRIVQVYRGASLVWDGKLDEAQPSAAGWHVTAHGAGNFGTDFTATYSGTWPTGLPDSAVNDAITRGLRWNNPGIGSPSGLFLGTPVDSGAQTVTDLLNLCTSQGGLTWYVNCRPVRNILSVFPLPTAVNRLLVSGTPVGRTLGGDFNTIKLRYQATADSTTGTGAVATFAVTTAVSQASIDKHGPMEAYEDLSSAGVMSAAAAQAIGASVLLRYNRASFSGPFTVGPGELLNAGGVPVDLGSEQAGTVVRLILTDFAYGGEVTPVPITFLVGGYSYDDDAQAATVTPFQYLSTNFASLLSAAVTRLPGVHTPAL